MIPVLKAVRIASDYVKTLFPDALDLRLEEVEVDKRGAWDVTLSFRQRGARRPPNGAEAGADPDTRTPGRMAIGIDPARSFKVVELDPKGIVKAVRIRPIVVG
jgi:hypothetical protein